MNMSVLNLQFAKNNKKRLILICILLVTNYMLQILFLCLICCIIKSLNDSDNSLQKYSYCFSVQSFDTNRFINLITEYPDDFPKFLDVAIISHSTVNYKGKTYPYRVDLVAYYPRITEKRLLSINDTNEAPAVESIYLSEDITNHFSYYLREKMSGKTVTINNEPFTVNGTMKILRSDGANNRAYVVMNFKDLLSISDATQISFQYDEEISKTDFRRLNKYVDSLLGVNCLLQINDADIDGFGLYQVCICLLVIAFVVLVWGNYRIMGHIKKSRIKEMMVYSLCGATKRSLLLLNYELHFNYLVVISLCSIVVIPFIKIYIGIICSIIIVLFAFFTINYSIIMNCIFCDRGNE